MKKPHRAPPSFTGLNKQCRLPGIGKKYRTTPDPKARPTPSRVPIRTPYRVKNTSNLRCSEADSSKQATPAARERRDEVLVPPYVGKTIGLQVWMRIKRSWCSPNRTPLLRVLDRDFPHSSTRGDEDSPMTPKRIFDLPAGSVESSTKRIWVSPSVLSLETRKEYKGDPGSWSLDSQRFDCWRHMAIFEYAALVRL